MAANVLLSYRRGQGSIICRVHIGDRSSGLPNGTGKTGLTHTTTNLLISTIADNEATPTVYSNASSTTETITTLGTFAAPTATKCRFKEVDATNHKGVYELQFADARYAVSSAKSLLVTISINTNSAEEVTFIVPLTDYDPYDVVRQGMTALPNVVSGSTGAVLTSGTGTAQLSVSGGTANANVTQISGDSTAADNAEAFFDGTGYAGTNNAIPTVGAVTGTVSAFVVDMGDGVITDAAVSAAAVTKIQAGLSTLTQSQVTGGVYSIQSASCTLGDTRIANLDAAVSSVGGGTPPTAAAIATQVRTELATELARIDIATSTRLASASYAAPPSAATISTQVASDLATAHGAGSWATATGFSTHTAADVWTATTRRLSDGTNIVLAKGTGVTGFNDIAAGTQMDLVSAPNATALLAIANKVEAEIIDETDSERVLSAITDKIASVNPSLGGLTLAAIATANRVEMDSNSTKLASIVADTNELQTDLVDGGRLDLIIDSRASQTSVDDLPTNAELATSQAAADDATLAAIAALNNLTAAQVRTELATELARIDVATSTRNATTPPTAAAVASQVRTELTTELARIDVATSTRLATAGYTAPDNTSVLAVRAKTDLIPATPAATGDAMTLTAGERVSIGTAVWATTTRTLSSFGDLVSNIWAAVTRTLTSSIAPTAAEIATALFVDGGANKLKVNADNTVTSGVTLSQDNIDDIAAAVSDVAVSADDLVTAFTGRTIRINSPWAAGGSLTIYSGDDYVAANSTSLSATITARTDLIGMIPHLYLESKVLIELTASAVVSGTETLTFGDLTAEQTLTLWDGIGNAPAQRVYQIKFVDGSGNVQTVIDGVLYVRRGV